MTPPPKLQLPEEIEPPTPTYSPNSGSHSSKSTSITGRTSFQIPELSGDSTSPRPSSPQPQSQNGGQLSPNPESNKAQYASKRSSNRGSKSEGSGYPEEKKRRSSYRLSIEDFRRSFVDVKDLRRPIDYSYVGTVFVHIILVSLNSSDCTLEKLLNLVSYSETQLLVSEKSFRSAKSLATRY